MGENGFSFSPIFRHFLSFLLFLDTFSLISRSKSVQKQEKIDFCFLPFLDTFCRFSLFWTLFLIFQPKKCLEKGENEISKNVTDLQTPHHYIYIIIIMKTTLTNVPQPPNSAAPHQVTFSFLTPSLPSTTHTTSLSFYSIKGKLSYLNQYLKTILYV